MSYDHKNYDLSQKNSIFYDKNLYVSMLFFEICIFFLPYSPTFFTLFNVSIGKEARSWIVDKFIWPHLHGHQCWIEMDKIHHIMLKLRHIKLKYILEGQDTPIEKKETSNWV